MRDIGETIKYTLLALLVIAILTIGTLALQGQLYPWWLAIQRQSVEQSKSFTDANNNMLATYILEHAALDTKTIEANDNAPVVAAYKAQQKAIVAKMCLQISTMDTNTVKPNTLTWLNNKGGCR
jgi:hypothetical protein